MDNRKGTGEVSVSENGGVMHVHFADKNILDEPSIQRIGQQLCQLIEGQDGAKLLLDFSNVEHLSSSALGMLITLNKASRRHKSVLKLSNISQQIYEVFSITRLDRVFDIYDDADQALGAF